MKDVELKLSFKQLLYLLAAVLMLVLFVILITKSVTNKHGADPIPNTISAPIDYRLHRLTYEPSSNMLYLPELKVKLPYNEFSKTLLYSERLGEGNTQTQEIDIVTDKFIPPQQQTTLNCTKILRLKIEDKQNPYNPAEAATTYKLQDGRNLQVYVFNGELEGNSQCKDLYQASNITPADFLNAFQNVQTY